MLRIMWICFLLGILAMTAGCHSVIRGNNQDVYINVRNAPRAKITIKDTSNEDVREKVVGNGQRVTLRRGNSYEITVKSPGKKSLTRSFDSKISPDPLLTLLSLYPFGGLPLLVDLAMGSLKEVEIPEFWNPSLDNLVTLPRYTKSIRAEKAKASPLSQAKALNLPDNIKFAKPKRILGHPGED